MKHQGWEWGPLTREVSWFALGSSNPNPNWGEFLGMLHLEQEVPRKIQDMLERRRLSADLWVLLKELDDLGWGKSWHLCLDCCIHDPAPLKMRRGEIMLTFLFYHWEANDFEETSRLRGVACIVWDIKGKSKCLLQYTKINRSQTDKGGKSQDREFSSISQDIAITSY